MAGWQEEPGPSGKLRWLSYDLDVWDALPGEGVNQPAWPREKAIEYPITKTGVNFDPSILPLFLEMIWVPALLSGQE
jgi:hypothetical protein